MSTYNSIAVCSPNWSICVVGSSGFFPTWVWIYVEMVQASLNKHFVLWKNYIHKGTKATIVMGALIFKIQYLI